MIVVVFYDSIQDTMRTCSLKLDSDKHDSLDVLVQCRFENKVRREELE